VDSLGHRAGFSSVGVDTNGRVKPNVAAMGVQTVVASTGGGVGRGNGTSFASPIISGLTACLWQSHPSVTNYELYTAIQRSASQYSNPDSLLGYGIPNFSNAFVLVSVGETSRPVTTIYPNPFTDHISLNYSCNSEEPINLELFDQTGRIVVRQSVMAGQGRNTYVIRSLSGLSRGIYLLRLSCPSFTETKKIVKL